MIPKDARVSRLEFLTSAATLAQCPTDAAPEVAMIGRSNAGKSSLINGIANSKIAMVSSTPGKTRLLNFFETDRYRLVDMPGYGFAARPAHEQQAWQMMIESYLAARTQLVGLVIVMDIRRDWSDDERNLLKWMAPRELPSVIALTKADKLSRSASLQRAREIQKQSGVGNVLITSALKKDGFIEFEDFLYSQWIKPWRERSRRKA